MTKFRLTKRISVLFILSIGLILLCVGHILFDYERIRDPYGLGIVAMVILISAGVFGMLVDYALYKLIKNRLWLNVVELLFVLIIVLLFAI